MNAWLRWRTVVDRLAAAILAVLLAPLVVILAVVVRRGSPGPSLLALPRVGEQGRPFRIWKIRTMYAAEPSGRAHGSPITAADDSRVTPVGRSLRRSHLDELPQLWNVACGEMALLGPRPEAPEYVNRKIPGWNEVLRARPGIAGPTQVLVADLEAELVGAGHSYQQDILPIKLAIDRWYIDHASPKIDALILSALVGRIVFGLKPQRLLEVVRAAVPEAKALDGC